MCLVILSLSMSFIHMHHTIYACRLFESDIVHLSRPTLLI